ncbi:MAG TPA: DNA-binding response regulator [Gammaproteobacteria bacterium]|nr:DNA-binding response regulator [Gammaproteobacteria bacterium]
MTRVLLVEDDAFMVAVARQMLATGDYQVVIAATGRDAIKLIRERAPDVILLDLGLPDMEGTQLIPQLRTLSSCPLIVVSARDDTMTKVTALDLGADDYILKPFVSEELLARLRSVLRRATPSREIDRQHVAPGIDFDPELRVVRQADGRQTHLTTIESMLLGLLVSANPRPISRQSMHPVLFDRPWTRGDRTLDVHVHNLRQKLLGLSDGNLSIGSIRGIGYVLQIRGPA